MTLLEIFLPVALAGSAIAGSPDATAWPTTTTAPTEIVGTATDVLTSTATSEPTGTRPATEPSATTQRPTATRPTPTATPSPTPGIKQTPAMMRAWTLDNGARIALHAMYVNPEPYPVYVYQPSVEVVDASGAVLALDDNSRQVGVPIPGLTRYCFTVEESLSKLPGGAASYRLPAGGETRIEPLPSSLVPRYAATPAVQVERDEIERDGQDYFHRMRAKRTDAAGPVTVTSAHYDGRDAFLYCTRAALTMQRDVLMEFTLTTRVDLRHSKRHDRSFW